MLIDEVRLLPVSDQMKLIQELSSSLATHLSRRPEESFWSPKSLEHHLKEQGVQPIDNLAKLKADFWPEDEKLEDFLAYTRKERAEALMREP